MFSTMSQPAPAVHCLDQKADRNLDTLGPDAFQTQLLRENNSKMKADRYAGLLEKSSIGEEVEGADAKRQTRISNSNEMRTKPSSKSSH